MAADQLKIPVYLSVAVLYFFFNSVFLPEGLLYTAIFTPFFLWWLYKQQSLKYLWWFFLFTLPFIPVHLYLGMEIWYYFRSYLLLFSSVVFGISFYVSLKQAYPIYYAFKVILVINFLLVIVALIVLPLPGRSILWYLKEFSPGISLPRLKLFTYEASYYSLLLVPVAIYFYLSLFLLEVKYPFLLFMLASLPLLLSMSFGVIACIVFALIVIAGYNARAFFQKKYIAKFFLAIMALMTICSLFLLIYFPGNPLFRRIDNIFSGKDTSFRGRTYEAFTLAWRIARQKSILLGCGLGQAKIIGIDVFKNYYGYLPPVVRIPNTLGDTLVIYGLLGVFARLFFSIYLFFKTKVYRNYYCMALYLFIFIYQFTGSFMTNIAEYVIWILAFTPVFREFDISRIKYTVPYGREPLFI